MARSSGNRLEAMEDAPRVTIHLTGPLRPYCAGASRLSVEAGTVKAALEQLARTEAALYRNLCDETGALRRHLNVFVNSDNVRDRDGVLTALTAGDVVTFLPAVSGG
jgi:molybdopterin converting factor small subunit